MSDIFTTYSDILKGKGNPYHDERGRFTSGPGGSSGRDFNRGKKTKLDTPPDELYNRMRRYRSKSGLSMKDFISEVHNDLRRQEHIFWKPTKAVMASGQKYLAFLRLHMAAGKIEGAFAHVLDRYA